MLPPSQMQRLYALHGRAPWRMLTFPQATHMDAYIVACTLLKVVGLRRLFRRPPRKPAGEE